MALIAVLQVMPLPMYQPSLRLAAGVVVYRLTLERCTKLLLPARAGGQ